MKKKYYYDCPIKALYMMREFGVNFSEAHGTNHADKFFQINESELCDFATGVIEDFRGIEQIYVKPESEYIFEPKDGDVGQMKAVGARFFVKYNESSKQWKESHYGGCYSKKNGSDIIMRDGKHFFNPKEEN